MLFPFKNPKSTVQNCRKDFPILARKVHQHEGKHGLPLVYLDSAASAQKPLQVIEAMRKFMLEDYANVHRGVHYLSQQATDAYENSRKHVATFINAPSPDNIVFTSNATEAFNLLANGYGQAFLKSGDEIILSVMEHHANIVPWQLFQQHTGIVIKVLPMDDSGKLDLERYSELFTAKTKLVSITHASNVLGTINPVKEIARIAHEHGAHIAIDGSQAVVHERVDVKDIDADFYIFTGHKLYGPTGIGVLYGKPELLKKMPPYQGGGEMITSVSFEKSSFREPPARFEAGTPPIIEAVGLAAAMDYVTSLGWENIQAHEAKLLAKATEQLSSLPGLTIHGTATPKASIVSFSVEGIHSHDLGTALDREGIAVRVGNHCAEPLLKSLGIPSVARASFAVYNTKDEVERLVVGVKDAIKFFR